jgi:hypothetical protein
LAERPEHNEIKLEAEKPEIVHENSGLWQKNRNFRRKILLYGR